MPKHPKSSCNVDALQTLAEDIHDLLDDALTNKNLCCSCVGTVLVSCIAAIAASVDTHEGAIDMVADMNEKLRLVTTHMLRSRPDAKPELRLN